MSPERRTDEASPQAIVQGVEAALRALDGGDVPTTLARFEAVRRQADGTPMARFVEIWEARAWDGLGWTCEARERLEPLAGHPAGGEALADLYERHGEVEGAIPLVEDLEPSPYRDLRLGLLLARAGRGDDAAELLVSAARGAPDDAFRDRAVDRLLEYGLGAAAESVVAEREDPASERWTRRLRFWREGLWDEDEEAWRRSVGAGGTREAATLRAHLQEAPGDLEARLWLAECELEAYWRKRSGVPVLGGLFGRSARDRAREALAEVRTRLRRPPPLPPALLVLESMAELDRLGPALPTLEAILGREVPGEVHRSETRLRPFLEEALAALRFNRSEYHLAYDAEGAPRACRPALVFRERILRTQHAVVVRGVDATLSALADMATEAPDSPLPHTYRGEIHLWLGELEAAEAAFREALAVDGQTRWAWIGLGAVSTIGNDHEKALETFAFVDKKIGAGPSLFAYRGESFHRLGRHAEARADLESLLEKTPTRIGAWAALVLVAEALGDRGLRDRAVGELVTRAAGLVHDLDPSAPLDFAESCLERLGGNRASACVVYRSPDGALRHVPAHGPEAQRHVLEAWGVGPRPEHLTA